MTRVAEPATAPAPAPVRPGPSRVARTGILAVTALWVSLLLGASLVWPVLDGYDEPQHLDMAYVYSRHPLTFYGPAELRQTAADLAAQRRQPGFPPTRSLALQPIEPRAERPSLLELGGPRITDEVTPNQMVQHPPLYYWLGAAVLRAPGVGDLAWDLQVWLVRLLGVLLLSPLPWLAWASARRLLPTGPSTPRSPGLDPGLATGLPLAAACLPLTIPNLVRVGASVSNDTLLILSSSVLLYLLTRVVTGDLTRRTAAWVAAALAVALLAKGFALVLPPVVALAYLLGSRRPGSGSPEGGPAAPVPWRTAMRTIWRPAVVVAIGGAVGASWWVRNLVLYGTVQPGGGGQATELRVYGPITGGGSPTTFVPAYLTQFTERIWSGIGLADSPSMGPFLTWGWLTLAVVGLLCAVTVRGAPGDRRRLGILLLAVPLTVAVSAAGSFATNRLWPQIVAGAQGRYIYHLLVPLAVGVVVGLARVLRPSAVRALAPVFVVGALVTNATAWVLVLQEWYSPGPGQPLVHLPGSLTSLVRWSPVPSLATMTLVVAVPVLLGLLALVVTVRDARRGSAPDPGPAPAPGGPPDGGPEISAAVPA